MYLKLEVKWPNARINRVCFNVKSPDYKTTTKSGSLVVYFDCKQDSSSNNKLNYLPNRATAVLINVLKSLNTDMVRSYPPADTLRVTGWLSAVIADNIDTMREYNSNAIENSRDLCGRNIKRTNNKSKDMENTYQSVILFMQHLNREHTISDDNGNVLASIEWTLLRGVPVNIAHSNK